MSLIETAGPELNFIAATRAFIRCHLPEPFHRTQEYEYECDTDTGKPLRLMVWKRNSKSRNTQPRVIVLNPRTQDLLAPIIQELTAKMDPLAMD